MSTKDGAPVAVTKVQANTFDAFLKKNPETLIYNTEGLTDDGKTVSTASAATGNYTPYRRGKMDDWSDEEKAEHPHFGHQTSVQECTASASSANPVPLVSENADATALKEMEVND
ncbi:hypothetical protein BV898_17371 [Hypsibius exemplaris]|uniref:Uncharacterized protein n=1 Tax=Hypsibius exemplaris TaxID=2072580 RepID=A0A9X6NNI1_HYPEX|nr:hypothetical protein BV898_17371 [Hypsibius exemplaris]